MNQLSDIEILELEARMNRVLDALIPIYYVATADHEADCQSKRNIKHHQRSMLRIKMAHEQTLITQYEKELNLE